jgi:ATP-dependent protease Clp ATPase subunit
VKAKAPKTAHTANTKKGLGDFYGQGVRQKLGKMVEGMGMKQITPKKLRKPPKSLA